VDGGSACGPESEAERDIDVGGIDRERDRRWAIEGRVELASTRELDRHRVIRGGWRGHQEPDGDSHRRAECHKPYPHLSIIGIRSPDIQQRMA
jgi:hypothetical protein